MFLIYQASENIKIQHVLDSCRHLYIVDTVNLSCAYVKYFIFHYEQQNAYIKTLKTQKQRILSAMNFDSIAGLPQHGNGSFSRPISIIAFEKRSRLFATDISDYVTAVKASDASMKCSTHAETTAVGIASNVYEQLPLGVICRTARIAPRNKRHESSRDRNISRLVHRFMKIFSSRFADKASCEQEAMHASRTLTWGEDSTRQWFPEQDYFESAFRVPEHFENDP